MLDIRVGKCDNCNDITLAIEAIDKRIAKIVKSMYMNLTLYSEKKYSFKEIKTLIRYKNILANLYYNGYYYEGFDYRQIISRVKSLT